MLQIGREKEQRCQPRRLFPIMVDYNFLQGEHNVNRKGITINASRSGLCIFVFHPISEGDELKINSVSFPYQWARVRWVKKITSEIYKAGLIYI